MATNPNYRPPDRQPAPHIVEQIEKPNRFPWPLVALVVAGVILAAIIYALPRTPKNSPGPVAGQVPDQPFATQLQFKGLRVSSAPVGGQSYIYGEIENTGSNAVGQVTVDAAFTDAQGHQVQRETRNLEFLTDDKGAPAAATSPLKPRQSMPFRVAFDGIPASWNHEVPQMRIVHVAAPGQSGIPESAEGGVVDRSQSSSGASTAAPSGNAGQAKGSQAPAQGNGSKPQPPQ
ncbi:MAG TPA: FxLYD domain-containing protein [Terriglobales bacterium]|nr:FxLYD domain-containing protein [Terriglobales bacterium]